MRGTFKKSAHLFSINRNIYLEISELTQSFNQAIYNIYLLRLRFFR